LQKLLDTKVYNEVLIHTNFNPRIIETISNYANSKTLTDDEYVEFMREKFDNPAELWERPFKAEISPMARQILGVLWSFAGQVEFLMLKQAMMKISKSTDYEFTLEFEDSIRQLDGNFINTNIFLGRNRKNEHLIVEFQNPSVEEFIENTIVRNKDSWLNLLIQSCVSINQVKYLIRFIENKNKPDSLPQLKELRKKAHEYKNTLSGALINFSHYNEKKFLRTWSFDKPNFPSIVLLLLQLEKATEISDVRREQVSNYVFTYDGWRLILENISHDTLESYSIFRLQQWIINSSQWVSNDLKKVETLLREAALELLSENNHYGWPIDGITIETLADTLTLVNPNLSLEETKVLKNAAIESISSILESYSKDESMLEEQIEALGKLCKKLNISLDNEIERLREAINDIQFQDEEEEERISIKRYEESAGDFNVDILFNGLIER
jgi:hypothetical protein